jgi:hypothetical protein
MHAEVMNDDYVGTVELACGARFQLKAPEAVGISGKGLREDLNGDVAAEAFTARAINLTHPACA